MIEQTIEKKIIDTVTLKLDENGLSIQTIGVLLTATGNDIKGIEDKGCDAILVVKTYPRSYDTFTVPYANIQVDITLTVRSDVDIRGQNYIQITDAITTILHDIQKSFTGYYDTFVIDGQFEPVGFRMESGDYGLDRDNAIWQYTQTITINGIITV